MRGPTVLCIMDGIGIGEENANNAYYLAKTPTLDYLKQQYPYSKLECSGQAVGLPDNQMGNSEVGHLNIGAGRIVYQSLSLINKSLEDESFYKNDSFIKAMENAKKNNTSLHLIGLLSDGGVHSHIEHLKALLKMAKDYGLSKVYIHAFMDGRDTLQDNGVKYLNEIIDYSKKLGCGQIASISGRYYAMDRDKRFERNELVYNAMVLNEGPSFEEPLEYLKSNYDNELYDEFIIPAYNSNVNASIESNDSVIFYNFRPDRAIQLSALLTNPSYEKVFAKQPENLTFVCMMKYDQAVNGMIAFQHETLDNVLGVFLANNNYTQLRIAETEKYAHVTFFFDGQVKYDGLNSPELKGCRRILINSPKVATYDLQPEMSAYEVKDALITELKQNPVDVVILNFANGDMVGHTGKLDAAISAVETVDACIKEIYDTIKSMNGTMLITADHGNCEQMQDRDGQILTSHTLNKVEFIVTNKDVKLKDGKLSDIAPTILDIMNIEKPKEMSGISLLNEEDK